MKHGSLAVTVPVKRYGTTAWDFKDLYFNTNEIESILELHLAWQENELRGINY